MDKRRVEVRGLNGAFYEAHIKFISGNMLAVVYENNPQLVFFVSCDSVRPPPPPHLSCEMTVGDEVEIYSRNSDGEPFGWWHAQIRMMIGRWCLVEYTAGGQEFVLPESIRPFNPNRLCAVETLVQCYCSEERKVRLQVPVHCCEEADREDQPCQVGVGDTGCQPAGGAGVEQERIHVTESRSWSLNSLSNEGHSSQPSDSGEHAETNGVCTEELWLSSGGVEPKPPKVSKSARRRRNRYKPRLQHTLNDKYNAEEIRSTPQGDRLFRLFGSRWVEMA